MRGTSYIDGLSLDRGGLPNIIQRDARPIAHGLENPISVEQISRSIKFLSNHNGLVNFTNREFKILTAI